MTISSRLDQVHLKLLAAADPKAGPRHMEDLLIRIKPTAEETRAAVTWLLDRKTSSCQENLMRPDG